MPALYSYKVRVLAALDAHYHPSRPIPISIRNIDSKYESDCNANRLFLPSTWRKRVKITLDRLVAENWLVERNDGYTPTPRLRMIIADEKVRLNVNQRNHEWRVFAGVAKKMEAAPVSNSGNAAPSSTPAGRTRNRTSLSAADATAIIATPASRSTISNPLEAVGVLEVDSSSTPAARTRNRISAIGVGVRKATSLVPADDAITVRKQTGGGRKVRYSDPGPLLSQAGPSSSTPTTINRKRRSLGSSSQGLATPTCSTTAASLHRHRNIVAPRTNRRHTLAVAPTRQRFAFAEPVEPVSREIQFFPLKQTLSARTRRALRRNALSEEMNDIDAEKRAGQKKNRELLAKLRAELAESSERLRELERELAAARFAPSVEPEELAPIHEEQEDDDYDMSYAPADSLGNYSPVTPARRSPPSVERHTVAMEVEQTPSSNRDQKIRDLEAMIEALRQDIAQRAEEERLRAQEDEVFHDAEEQIMHEENHALAEKIEELTALKGKGVSFDDGVGEVAHDNQYMRPLGEDFDDEATDIEHPRHATLSSSGVDSGIGTSSQMTMRVDLQSERIADFETQNDQLQQTIKILSERVREMEEDLEETQMGLAERKKAQDKLEKENGKLRRLEKELEGKVTELEEMEGERLENVGHMMIQTDEIVDEEKAEMEEVVDSLRAQVLELQKMIKVVTGEKQDAQAKIVVADAQIVALQSAAEAGEAAKIETETRIHALTMQIADLEDTISEEKREIERTTKVAHAKITKLQEIVESSEAAKINTEAQIINLTGQIKALEVIAEGKKTAENRIADLEADAQSREFAKSESQTQIIHLMDQIRDIEARASKESREAEAQLVNLRAVIESTEAAQNEARAQVHNLENQIRDLEEIVKAEQVEAESRLVAMENTESEIRALKREILDLEAESSAFEEEKSEMQQEIDILNRQVEGLDEELRELREENAELRQEMEDSEQKTKEFEEVAERLGQDKASLERGVESLEEKVEELEGVAADLAKAKAVLETGYTNLNAQLISQQKATDLAEKTSSQFQQNIAELRSHIEAFEKAAEISENEKASFERDIISLQGQVSSLENAHKLSSDGNKDLQNNIDELYTQIESFKQATEAAQQEKDQLENLIIDLRAQAEVLKRAKKVVEQQKESLQQTVDSLNAQLAQLTEELDASRAENELSMQEIKNYKLEIDRLCKLLDAANRDKGDLRHDIHELEEKVMSLEGAFKGSKETNNGLEHNIEVLQSEITTLKQASEIADEEKSIIQQKIRPYIQGEQALDMAVEEVLTELVMAKNRADENERLRAELSNKIRILAQDDEEGDSESINPEDIVEKLTDRFKEVRGSVEKLYILCEGSQGSPFEGYNLGDFAWTGSNECALAMLGSLIGDLYKKVTSAHARAEKMREDFEKEKEQVDELSEAVARKDNTIRDMEMDIESAGQRETEINKKVIDTIAAHDFTTTRLSKACIEIEELSKAIEDKEEDIEKLEVTIEKQAEKECELLKAIEQAHQENELIVKTLQDGLAASQAELNKTNKELEARKISYQQTVEILEGGLAQSRGEMVEVSQKLREQAEKSSSDILDLETKLRSSAAEVKRQVSALKGAEARLDKVTNQLNSVIDSNQDAVSSLEQKIQENIMQAEVQQEDDRQIISSLKIELQIIRNKAEGEKETLRANIRSQAEEISQLTCRIEELEELLEEAEDEHLKAIESQSQLFKEEAGKAQEALAVEKRGIQQELVELKHEYSITQRKMQGDITILKALVEEKSQRILELENNISILRSEGSKLQGTITELDEERIRLEDMLQVEQRKDAELMQNLSNEVTKFMARFGDVKNQHAREGRLRQAEELKNRRKRAREEQEDEEGGPSRMPPTPASSVVAGSSAIEGLKKRENKRRRYDSGIGVDEEDEEFEGISAVGV